MAEEKKDFTSQAEKDSSIDSKTRGKKTNYRRGKGRKPRSKSREFTPGNDFTFWNEYPELMEVAAKYPWMHIAGTPLTGNKVRVNLPNVAVQHYYPIPGVQNSPVSALNLMFRNMYLDMHRKYRGIGTYQASDIAITVLCIESIYQMIVEAERVYGVLNTYPVKTRIQPSGLLLALGYSSTFIDSVKANMADFRYGINRLIRLAQRLPLPSGMSFFANHVALNAFVYKDSEDERAAYLAFVCDGFFKYRTTIDSDAINAAGTALLEHFDRGSFSSYGSMLAYLESFLSILLNDSDILRITSDFIACYGVENMQTILSMPEDFVVTPIYDQSILFKWHNSERYDYTRQITFVAVDSTTKPAVASCKFAVYQLDDVIYSLPVISDGSGSWDSVAGVVPGHTAYGITVHGIEDSVTPFGHLVDSWEADPDIAQHCEAVLWKAELKTGYGEGSGDALAYVSICSTELMGSLEVYEVSNGLTVANALLETSWDIQNRDQYPISGLMHFDWHPYLFVLDAYKTIIGVLGDTDNVSVINEDVIEKIIDAALLSAFKIKVVGSSKGE